MVISYFDSKEYADIKKSHPMFEKAFDAAEKLLLTDPADGRYDVEGDDVYIAVSTYETKPLNGDRRFEAHREYIDIQLLLSGRELIGFAPMSALEVTDEYRPDYELYGMVDIFDKVMLEKGKFAVIYPGEPHAPGLAADKPEQVRKMVIKVRA
jgi:YhcH/YjgK/YiaL family protein